MVRIAYLINQYPKVSHSFIRTEMLALEERGFDIARVALRGWDAEIVDPVDRAERDRTRYLLRSGPLPLLLAVLAISLSRPIPLVRTLLFSRRLSRGGERGLLVHLIYVAEACSLVRLLRKLGVDHVHAHFGTNAATVALLARRLEGPTYSFTVHGPEEFDKPLQLKLREKIADAAFVVAITSFCRSQLYRWCDHDQWDKIAVIHCGLDAGFLNAKPEPPPSTRRLVCVGRLCEQKGQLLLLDAIAGVVAGGVSVTLSLAGDGEMRPEIEARIRELGLDEVVRITGWLSAEQVRGAIAEADALVLASFAEGLPVALMEAMALGRPVITTAIAGVPELVRDGVDGYVIPAGDATALADAIRKMTSLDPDVRERLGANARERVRARHAIAVEAEKLGRHFAALA